MAKISIGILGPGAVGGFVAVLLARAGHEVTCITRPESLGALKRDGITLESSAFGTFTTHPEVVEELDRTVEILFITTKDPGLRGAVRRVPQSAIENAVVIPLLNGIEHMAFLHEYFAGHVAAGSIGTFEASLKSPTVVVHGSSSAEVKLASDRDIAHDRLGEVARMLSSAGIPAQVLDRENDVLWGKLVRLQALALATAVSGKTIAEAVHDRALYPVLRTCVAEAAAVAKEEGVLVDSGAVLRDMRRITIGATTSLARDVERGDEGELDAIAGAIVRVGARHGLACPEIERMMAAIRARIAAKTKAAK